MKYLIEIGGTNLRIANFNLKKFEKIKWRGRFNPIEFVKEKTKNSDFVGIAIAGVTKGTTVIEAKNLGIRNLNLKNILKREVFLENDLNALAFAYRKYRNVISIGIGTGIGSGIVINGELYRGHFGAGEIGHIYLNSLHKKRMIDLETDLVGKFRNKKMNKNEKKKMERNIAILIDGLVKIFDPNAIVITGKIGELCFEGAKKIFLKEFGTTKLILAKEIDTLKGLKSLILRSK